MATHKDGGKEEEDNNNMNSNKNKTAARTRGREARGGKSSSGNLREEAGTTAAKKSYKTSVTVSCSESVYYTWQGFRTLPT